VGDSELSAGEPHCNPQISITTTYHVRSDPTWRCIPIAAVLRQVRRKVLRQVRALQ
jgi:hypothetical protein